MQEIFKDIVGYEGLYQISNLGNVKSLERKVIANHYGGVKTIKEKIVKQCNNKFGYKVVNLWVNNKFKTVRVHRLIAMAFIPNPDNKPYINHINCNPADNTLENLEWCTQSENIVHSYKLGRYIAKNGKGGKLKNDQVIYIKKYANLSNKKDIAKELNINVCTINDILNGRSWKHIII